MNCPYLLTKLVYHSPLNTLWERRTTKIIIITRGRTNIITFVCTSDYDDVASKVFVVKDLFHK